jgi:hypothetical protein
MTVRENGVRSHSVVIHDETPLTPTWYNIKSKLSKSDNQTGRFESSRSESIITANKFAPLLNFPNCTPRRDKVVSSFVKCTNLTNFRSRKTKKPNQSTMFTQYENQCKQHCIHQSTTINIEHGGGIHQGEDMEYCQILTVIKGYIDPPQMSVPSKSQIGSSIRKPSKMKNDHKVVIYGDSHSQGLPERLKDKLPESVEVTGYTKPNCYIYRHYYLIGTKKL